MSDWYHINTYYGYKVSISDGYSYREFIDILNGLNSVMEHPFQFKTIIKSLYLDNSLKEIHDSNSTIIIGFDLNDIDNLDLVDTLTEYVIDNPLLSGIDISKTPRFHSGIDLFHIDLEEYDEDSDKDSDEYETIP